ncbi:MAG: Outer membrane protein assembly factor BamB [Verrucomicrobia subdivision 3 bacterium]|nr:Outer membrane protein assembly factor BamB [Limisphaerales bacterium]MCS1414335.1 Outer membrane protein assembly factor BamB [Limisphaerales bacterium]
MNTWDINAIRAAAHLLTSGILLWPPFRADSSEWPRFLGPHQNGVLPTETLPDSWPGNGPKKLWQRSVGSGFGGPIALDDRIILHHRTGNEEQILSLDPLSGEAQWQFDYATTYRDDFGFDNGPRSTPTAYEGYLYTYGAQGKLYCLELDTGKPVWNVDTKKEFKAPKGFFGIACSPLVEGDLVIINVGSPKNGGIVAFDRLNGAVRWKTSHGEASYSSPVAATIANIRQALFFDREGLKAVAVETGKIRSAYPWRPRINASVNAASPVVYGNQVLLTTSYRTGAVVLDLTQTEPKKVWSNDNAISCHYSTPILHRGYLYGFHGRQEWGAPLNCVSWKTGEVQWSQPSIQNGSVIIGGNKLLALQENGELVLVNATEKRYQELDRAQILPSDVRSYPALANGIIYARSPKILVAYRLR